MTSSNCVSKKTKNNFSNSSIKCTTSL